MFKVDKSTLLAAVIGVAVFAAVFFALSGLLKPREQVINGVLVQAENPREAIAGALAPQALVEHIAVADENESIPGRAAAAAEIASALAVAGKNVTVQGSIRGEYCVNEKQERVECGAPSVLVNYSGCNCVRVESGKLYVLGTENWLLNNGARVRGLIRWALEKN